MAEVTGALSHASSTSLAACCAINDSLARVHQAPEFWSTALVHLWELDSPVGDGHAADLLGAEDAKLDALYRTHRRLRISRVNGRHDEMVDRSRATSSILKLKERNIQILIATFSRRTNYKKSRWLGTFPAFSVFNRHEISQFNMASQRLLDDCAL